MAPPHILDPHADSGEAGMATAELATALPVLVLCALAAVAAVVVGQDRIRCADGAREAARALARGDAAHAAAYATAGAGRPVSVSLDQAAPGLTRATVTMTVRPLGWLPGVSVSETASVASEPADPM